MRRTRSYQGSSAGRSSAAWRTSSSSSDSPSTVSSSKSRRAAEDLPADESWEERVRRKAHELWQEEGGQHGRAEDHWRIASQLVGEEIAQSRADLPYLGDTDAPPEEAALLDNLGEFPDLADQGQDETSEPPER